MAVIQQKSAPIIARLNPFVFPADTHLRFALLIVALVSASLFAFNWLHSVVSQADQSAIVQCQLEARKAYPVDTELLQSNPEQYTQQLATQAAASELCIAPFNRLALIWMLCGTLTLFIVATAIYLLQPALRIRRDQLKRLSAPKFQPLRVHLSELQQQARIQQPIMFLANPTSREVGGTAFGRLGQYYIALPGGLLIKFSRDPEGFDAIVLHEIAHLRNKDIDITYFAIALWQAFVIVALIPFVAVLVASLFLLDRSVPILDIAWRIVPLTALVYIYHRGVLRAREYYADIRASTWDDSPDALARVVASAMPPAQGWWTRIFALTPERATRWTKLRPLARRGQHIRQMLAFHPDPGQRGAALSDPSVIFPISVEEAIGIGVVAGVAMPQLSFVAQLLVPTVFESWAFALAALFVGPLIAGVLGVGIWRSIFAHIHTKRSERRPFLLATGLMLGIAGGAFISFDAAVPLVGPDRSTPATLGRGSDALFFVIWCVLMLMVLYVFVRWIQATAENWLPTATKYRTLQHALRLNLTVIGILLIFWIALIFISYSLGIAGFAIIATAVLSGHIGTLIQLTAPFVIVSSILLWGLPLVATLNRKPVGIHTPTWVFIGASTDTQMITSAQMHRASPHFAVLAGLIGGLIAGILLVCLSIGKSLLVSEIVQENGQFLEFYWYMRLILAVLFQAALAGIVAATIPSNGWIHGLCATFFATALITLSLLGLSALAHAAISLDLVWSVYTQVATWSVVLSIPVALMGHSLGNMKRRLLV